MSRLVFWRLARTGLAVWALASAVFLLTYRDLDAAVRSLLPDTADLPATNAPAWAVNERATQLQALRHRFGLDLPLFYVSRPVTLSGTPSQWHWNGATNQYHRWLTNLLHGDLGTSLRTGQPVASQLGHALSFTLPLTVSSALLTVLATLALAQRLAARPWWYGIGRGALVAMHVLPLFVVAVGLLLLFANPEVFAWFPAFGLDQFSDADASFASRLLTYSKHLVLPVIALVLVALPELTLQLEAALSEVLGTDYATTARAKGLSTKAVIRHHALRNAILPTLTQITELLPTLVAGSVVVEVIFALPGMGRLLAQAAASRDYPVLVGGVLLTGAARLLALLVADVLYYWADPRIRWQSS